jgi:hypothetical protein
VTNVRVCLPRNPHSRQMVGFPSTIDYHFPNNQAHIRRTGSKNRGEEKIDEIGKVSIR